MRLLSEGLISEVVIVIGTIKRLLVTSEKQLILELLVGSAANSSGGERVLEPP